MDRPDGVRNGDRGVGVGTGVEHDAVVVEAHLMDLRDDLTFRIALEILQIVFRVAFLQYLEILVEGSVAVHRRFASSQQVEIRTVEDQYFHDKMRLYMCKDSDLFANFSHFKDDLYREPLAREYPGFLALPAHRARVEPPYGPVVCPRFGKTPALRPAALPAERSLGTHLRAPGGFRAGVCPTGAFSPIPFASGIGRAGLLPFSERGELHGGKSCVAARNAPNGAPSA